MNRLAAILALLLFFFGCTFTRTIDVSVSGENVKSAYGSGDSLSVELKKVLKIGK